MTTQSAPPPDFARLLARVARSFSISIRLLPRGMREPVGVGYLLARAADTVADATALPTQQRIAALDTLADAIRESTPVALDPAWAAATADPHEARLLRDVPGCLHALQQLPHADRADVQAVLAAITAGQRLDLERFGAGGEVRALRSSGDAIDYMQRVAGCVGEFWTDVGARHVQGFARLPAKDLRALGRSYGQALQRINILRDARDDLAAGRCYFPIEELQPLGLTAPQIAGAPAAFETVWTRWLDTAEGGLRDGLRYALAVRPLRLRAATALPALIGARTVALLRAAGPSALHERVKMPRSEVRQLLLGMVLHLASRRYLRSTFERLLAGPPPARWDNAAP